MASLNSAVHASSQSYLAQEMTKGVGFRPGIGSFAFKPYTSVLYPFLGNVAVYLGMCSHAVFVLPNLHVRCLLLCTFPVPVCCASTRVLRL